MNNILKKYYLFRKVAKLRLKHENLSLKFHISNSLELEKVLKKDYETEVLNIFLDHIRPSDIIFDIGANIGLYTLPCALKANKGLVVAFEPVPMWFNRLQSNISLNSIRNVKIYNLGLFRNNQDSKITIKNICGSGMGSLINNYGENINLSNRLEVNAQFINGDTFISENMIPLPNMIKIDVEGVELDVLFCLQKTINQPCCRLILVEVHPQFMKESPDKIKKFLTNSGFQIKIIKERSNEHHILASKN